jgi:hypothetical protein
VVVTCSPATVVFVKFGNANNAVPVSFVLELWIFTLNIKMLPFEHGSSESICVLWLPA